MKKYGFLLLCFLFVLSLLTPYATVSYAAESTKQTIPYDLNDWIIDEENGYLYAVSTLSGKLLFIRIKDLKIENEVDVGPLPTRVTKHQNMLYVTLTNNKKIVSVSIDTKKKTKEWVTSASTDQIAFDEDRLFYFSSGSWGELYSIQLKTGQEEKVKTPDYHYSTPGILVDEQKHILYIGESGSTGSNVYALDTRTFNQLSVTTLDNGYGISNMWREMFLQDGALFYGGLRLNARDLAEVEGRYFREFANNIILVKRGYVFSEESIYDREQFVKLHDLPFKTDMIQMDSDNNLYLFDHLSKSIHKQKLGKISIPKTNASYTKNHIILDNKIRKWVYSEERQRIYAISQTANRLFIIEPNQMRLEKEYLIGSEPVDIQLFDEKLYISLWGSTKIAVIDLNDPEHPEKITTSTNPYHLAVDDKKLFYADIDQHQYVYVYELDTAQNKNTNLRYSYPDLEIDRKQDILYVAGSSDLAYHRTSDYQRLGEAAEMYGGGYEYPDPLQLDQNNLYYGYYRYDTKDMKKHIKQYPEPVLYAKEKYVFSKESVYDRDTAAKVAILPEVIDHALMNEAGEIFLYQKESGTISKYRSIGDMKNSGPVLTIDTPEITMQPSDKFWLHVTATFPDGTVRDVSKEIIWESSDYRVRVNNQYYGVFVKAFDECHAILTGTYKGQVVSATVDVIPEQASVTKLQIVPESLKGKVGKSIEAKVIATYSDDSEQDVTYKVDWSSSGFSIVQPFGAKLLPLKEGTATVIATYQDVRTNAQLNVVSQSKVEALIASEKSLNMDAGEVKKLKVTAKWDDGNREDVTSRAVWSSADTEVASVSDDGIVTANSNGRTVITANYDGMSVQIDVAVSGQKQLDFLEVTKNNLSLKIGEKRNLLVTAVYKGGAKEDVTEQAQWDVEDTKIAEVQKGMITAKSKGTTQVRVQFKDKTATIKVKVVGIKKLKFSKTSYKLKPGDQVELNVSAVYDDNSTTDVTDKVEFELSNPRIMQIKGSTLVAVAGGKGNVVAKFAGNSGKANVSVSGGLFLEGNFTDSAIHPSKPIVYMVDKTNRRVISYDYKTKQLNTISMEKMPERLLLSGDDLYVTLLTQEHSSYWWDEEQTGGIAVLNPMTLKIKDIMEINVDPFDIAADQDYLYVSSGSGQWTKLLSYSKASKEQIGESSIRQMSYIELNPILNRIYTVDTDTSPRDISAYPVKSGEIGKKLDSPYHGDYEMSPYFELSPDGNYLFNGAGTIFQTTNDRHDLEYVDSLGLEFVAASFQLKNNKFYVGNESEIYEYEYDSFDQLETYTVKGEVRYVFARDGQLIAVVKTGTNGDLEQYQIEILKLK